MNLQGTDGNAVRNVSPAIHVPGCRQGVFCMEGMWQRFFPASGALRALLRGGAIGRPLSVDARKTFLADEVSIAVQR
jgi:hypothetical protein